MISWLIRFGNGMGDIDRGGGVSGKSREDEAGLYWVQWHVDHSQGIPESEYRTSSSDRSATVSLSPRYAEYMNRASDGSLSDRVFVSYHSNGANGTARGAIGLYNGNNDPDTATPNQLFLARTVAQEVTGLIEEDRDIALMILAAGDETEGPGPLVSSIAGHGAAFPIPVTVVPATLTDEDIADLV